MRRGLRERVRWLGRLFLGLLLLVVCNLTLRLNIPFLAVMFKNCFYSLSLSHFISFRSSYLFTDSVVDFWNIIMSARIKARPELASVQPSRNVARDRVRRAINSAARYRSLSPQDKLQLMQKQAEKRAAERASVATDQRLYTLVSSSF